MAMSLSSASADAAPGPSAASETQEDTQLFQQLVQGFLTTGLTLTNSLVGDSIDALNQSEDAT